MCKCIKKILSCDDNSNTTILKIPHFTRCNLKGTFSENHVSIDNCLVNEVLFLWEKGIITTGCCCGHNILQGYIGVINDHVDIMISLGYERIIHNDESFDKNSFKPKSI